MSVIFLIFLMIVCYYHEISKKYCSQYKLDKTYILIVAFRPDEAPLGVAEVEAAGHPGDLPLTVHQDAGQVVHRLGLGLGVVMLTLGLKYS